jgi:hypothetical protein
VRKVALLLLVLTVLWAVDAALGLGFFWAHDLRHHHLPWRAWAAGEWLDGRMPGWCPDIGNGFPLASEGQTGVFYAPTMLLFMAFSPEWALNLSILLHVWWAGLGAFWMARVLGVSEDGARFAAIAFAFSGFLTTHTGYLGMQNAVAWVPWAVGLAMRGRIAMVGVVLFVLGACGHVQVLVMTAPLVAVLYLSVAWRERQKVPGFPFLIFNFMFLGAAFIPSLAFHIPTLDVVNQSLRAGGVSEAFANIGSLPFLELGNGVLPSLFGVDRPGDVTETYFHRGNGYWGAGVNHWETAFYLGLPTVILALLGMRKHPFWMALVAVSGVLMLGGNTPVWPLLRQLPLLDGFRFPVRFSLLLTVGVVVLAAYGLDRLLRGDHPRHLARWVLAAGGILWVGMAVARVGLELAEEPLRAKLTDHYLARTEPQTPGALPFDRAAKERCDALDFDGRGQGILVGDQSNLLGVTRDFSVSAWVWLDDSATQAKHWAIFSAENTTSRIDDRNSGFSLGICCGGKLATNIGAGPTIGHPDAHWDTFWKTPKRAPTHRWVHLATTREGQRIQQYVDGVLWMDHATGQSAPIRYDGGSYDHSRTLIGLVGPKGREMVGKIRQVGVWNRPLDAAEIGTLARSDFDGTIPGLVGYWPIDAGAGSVVVDKSGNAHHGIIVANPRWVKDCPAQERAMLDGTPGDSAAGLGTDAPPAKPGSAQMHDLVDPGPEPLAVAAVPGKVEQVVSQLAQSTSPIGSRVLTPVLVLFAFGGLLWARKRLGDRWLVWGLTALLYADLWIFGANYNVRSPPEEVRATSSALPMIQAEPGLWRTTVVDRRQDPALDTELIQSSMGLIQGTRDVLVPSPLRFVRHEALLSLVGLDVGDKGPQKWDRLRAYPQLVDLLGVRWLLSVHDIDDRAYPKRLDGPVKLYENPDALPSAFLVGCTHISEDTWSDLPALQPRRWALVESDIGVPECDDGGDAGTATVVSYEAQRVVIDVEAKDTAVLVQNDTHYPLRWRAEIDGRRVSIHRINHTFRGVVVPPGRHRIALWYRAPDWTMVFPLLIWFAFLFLMEWGPMRATRSS